MTATVKTDTLKVLATLAAGYPNFTLREETVRVYAEMLADIDADILRSASAKCLADCKWFPTIAELRQAATELSRPRLRAGAEAWGDVLAEVRRVGSYGAPQFADPAVARVVAGMGWTNICMSEEQMADRAHFIKAYEQTARREEEDARQLPAVRELAARLQAPNKRQLRAG